MTIKKPHKQCNLLWRSQFINRPLFHAVLHILITEWDVNLQQTTRSCVAEQRNTHVSPQHNCFALQMSAQKDPRHNGDNNPLPPPYSKTSTRFSCISLSNVTQHEQPSTMQKLTAPRPVKKFPAIYGTRRFITVFTRHRHLAIPPEPLQSLPRPTALFLAPQF